jgi:transcriptional regulator
MMSNEQFEKLMDKLDTLIKVTAASAFQGKSMTDSIVFLADLGLGNSEIASILGTTPAYVNKVKYEAKRAKETKKQKDKSIEEKVGETSSEN